MWGIFLRILKYDITPDECFFLYSIKDKISISEGTINKMSAKTTLLRLGYIVDADIPNNYVLTKSGKTLIKNVDAYIKKISKETDVEIMGSEFINHVETYRSIFPARKLPSGVPARNNVKVLTECFRWFFNTYNFNWAEIHLATRMYVNEYRDKEYQYMQNSQYFISKQDKNKVKRSQLADYCDMIKDGVDTEDDHFKEKVV